MTGSQPRAGSATTLLALLLIGACSAQNTPSPAPTNTGAPPSPGPTSGVSLPGLTALPPTDQPPTATPTAGGSPSPSPTITPPEPTSSPPATPVPSGEIEVWRTIPYATDDECGARLTECQQFADVYAPEHHGSWPVVVMVHGRPRTPADMAELARAVAAGGAVVFNIDYRGVRPYLQQGWPEAVEDVACAVRFARARAASFGGDGRRVVLVGHSFGGYLGTLVALAGDEFNGECLAPAESALPNAWVGVSANSLVGYPPPPVPIWTAFYGGSPSTVPNRWRKGDPVNHIGGNPELVVRLVHEEDDPVIPVNQARHMYHLLRDAGYDAELTILDGDDHWAPLDADSHAGEVTLGIIEDLFEQLG